MKNWIILLAASLLFIACSKSEDETKGETLGEELANRIKAPVEETRSVTDKIKATRQPDLPE